MGPLQAALGSLTMSIFFILTPLLRMAIQQDASCHGLGSNASPSLVYPSVSVREREEKEKNENETCLRDQKTT